MFLVTECDASFLGLGENTELSVNIYVLVCFSQSFQELGLLITGHMDIFLCVHIFFFYEGEWIMTDFFFFLSFPHQSLSNNTFFYFSSSLPPLQPKWIDFSEHGGWSSPTAGNVCAEMKKKCCSITKNPLAL